MTKLTHTNLELCVLSEEELKTLADNLRRKIIEVVSQNGGHLSSNLGVVELSIAMHYVFDSTKDPFIFDVSHQSYAHKLLSGREERFHTLRTFGGLSGYTKDEEGDYFIAGHSSTSISLAIGACKAIRLKKEERTPVVLIGDGALSAGMAYEALNELGDRKYPCVIILNDNEMSISKPIGAISKYLSQAMATQFYQKFKKRVEKMLDFLPDSATYMAKRFEEGFKLITPGLLFEELGLEYIGPIDGHNINEMINALKQAKMMQKPCIIHAQTIKGKGY
ncbi:1-deoxy-D-xylulose-5-phosphate synthase, partial [Campylobacter upsaliensis]|nr:1-deoxy-D-xylulose-5-phosphate synthase [Campylobacter upsaliensis]